jgi:hypothetical protein
MEDMLCRCAKLIRNWAMLNKAEDVEKLEAWVQSWNEEAQDLLI